MRAESALGIAPPFVTLDVPKANLDEPGMAFGIGRPQFRYRGTAMPRF